MLCKIIYKNFIKVNQDRQILSNLYGKLILKQKSKSFGNARCSQKWLLFYPDICNAGHDGITDILIIVVEVKIPPTRGKTERPRGPLLQLGTADGSIMRSIGGRL